MSTQETPRLEVDIKSLTSVSHTCDGCQGKKGSCCSRFDVLVTNDELSTILGMLPNAGKYARHLNETSDIFDEAEAGMYSLETDEDGLCVFAYTRGRQILCALHSAALELGLDPAAVKPMPCTLWPLSVSGIHFGALSIVDEDAWFPCVQRRKKPSKQISPALLDTIESLYGPTVRDGVAQAAAASLPTKTFTL